MNIIFNKITKSYDNQQNVISDLSFEIKENEFLTLIGPSGCGKSTILKLISGTEDITSGELLMNGEVMNGVAPQERNISMVFQNFILYPRMSVYENLVFGLQNRGFTRLQIDEKVRKMASLLGLEPYFNRKPKHLSGGQQQRLALGRALVRTPRVLLLDEPLSSIDKLLREDLKQLILQMHKELKIPFIYVTHDQKEALGMSDRIAVIKEGRIVQIGTPSEIYDSPVNQFVADFMGSTMTNFFAAKVIQDGTKSCLYLGKEKLLELACKTSCVDVIVGIRPEHFSLSLKPTAFSVVITNNEYLMNGAYIDCHLQLKEDIHLCFKVDTNLREQLKVGNSCYLQVVTKKILLFDAQSLQNVERH